MRSREQGFTLVEVLVAMTLFSIIATAFYAVLISGTRSSGRTRSIVRVSEEARAGLNRVIRDTREAAVLLAASPTSYRIYVDFNNNGVADGNTTGNFEDLTYAYVAASASSSVCPARFAPGCITLEALPVEPQQRLVVGVAPLADSDIFSYTSNLLLYDCNSDGITTWRELDAAKVSTACPPRAEMGNANGVLDDERPYITGIGFAFRVRSERSSSDFVSEVQMRNLR